MIIKIFFWNVLAIQKTACMTVKMAIPSYSLIFLKSTFVDSLSVHLIFMCFLICSLKILNILSGCVYLIDFIHQVLFHLFSKKRQTVCKPDNLLDSFRQEKNFQKMIRCWQVKFVSNLFPSFFLIVSTHLLIGSKNFLESNFRIRQKS